eukprot:CAMPEP_0203960458 /NCGR_PEP_ID=MMETSP0359-20131031/91152_1 /ASSEMBLY_ACC=CAM_ASM_000338 /TAXON_ID=268821 /ORGANISM="Scrippsiella Hangoei, Strain SHTV-5" /LENGTH=107 /DNA_ID=CAMNT_0050894809 /DNA_START=36 /DNA_END=356 /DNA_ORIENTATION=+
MASPGPGSANIRLCSSSNLLDLKIKPPTDVRRTDHEAMRHIHHGLPLAVDLESAAAAIAKRCKSNRSQTALAVDVWAGSSGHREEIQVQLLEDRRNVEQSPTLLHKP